METYKNIPKLSTIERIAQALDVEPAVLFKSNTLDSDTSKKMTKIKNEVISALEKELTRSLKKNL